MAGKLLETTVGEVCQVFDGPHATPTRLDAGPVFLGITSLNKGRIDLASSDHVSEEDFTKWTRRVTPKPGDVVFSYETKLGEAAIIPEGLRCCLGRRMGLMRPDPKKLDSRFLLFYYLGPEFQEVIRERTIHGSTVERLALIEFPQFPLRIPPLAEQKAIAAVLGALDDKIELNRRMNATLEAMARALFQSWFVDFDPVRAKVDGRQPVGLDPVTAVLFPNEFNDSDLGPIPKGWRAGTVVEEFNLTMGQSPPGTTYNEEGHGIPLYQGKTDFGFRFPTRRIFCTAPTRYAKAGDTLVSVRAPVGDINMANEECCVGRGVAAVRHKTGATSFTYYSMANLYPDFARFEAEGTVFGSINKQSFEKLPFVTPPAEVVADYERRAAPIDDQIRLLEEQFRTLSALRDTLLPTLLSGEVSIPAADTSE
jgi:type I restriction enzyme S subunit